MGLLTDLLGDGNATSSPYVVEHGSDAGVARPAYDGVVMWVGTVVPTNAEATDIVVKNTGASESLWLPPGRFVVGAGSPTQTLATNWPVWSHPDGSSTAIHAAIHGSDVEGWSTFDVVVWWTNLGAGTGNVLFFDHSFVVDGDGDTLTNATSSTSTAYAQPGQYVIERTTHRSGLTAPTASQIGQLKFGRNGGGGADTSSDAIGVLGIELVRAS